MALRTETYKQFKKRVLNDPMALNFIFGEYFTSHPDYNEETDRIEEVM